MKEKFYCKKKFIKECEDEYWDILIDEFFNLYEEDW